MGLLTSSNVIWGGTLVHAEEPQKFLLDEMIVTATRYEKADVDVPASTTILTAEELKNTGAENIQMALQKVSGISYTTYGPGGNPYSTSRADIFLT